MAIITYDQPEAYQLAYNDNVYVFRSALPTYRYSVRIYPLGSTTPIATMKVYATPATNGSTDRAFVDVSRILQSKLGHDISIPEANHLAFKENTNSHFEYYLKIGEESEDGSLSRPTTYDGKSVWNGVQNNIDWLDFTSADYLMTTGVGTTKFLSDAPSTREINSAQSAYLYLIATENDAPNRYQLITYDDYDGGGSIINNTTVANPHAALLDGSYKFRYLRMPVGTYDIPLIDISQFSSGNPATILNNAKSYQIRLQDNIGVGQVISETITFNIDKNCSKFTPIRLHWMNRLGGFDSFNLELKSEESTDVMRKQYDQQPHTFTGFGWDYTKADRGRTQYDTQLTKRLKVNTNYLSETESTWMESLFTSPEVYQELSNELIAVNIDGRSIRKQTSLNDKLMQYSFDLEYSIKNMRQRG